MEPDLSNTEEDFEEDNFTEEEIDAMFAKENMVCGLMGEIFMVNVLFEKPPF